MSRVPFLDDAKVQVIEQRKMSLKRIGKAKASILANQLQMNINELELMSQMLEDFSHGRAPLEAKSQAFDFDWVESYQENFLMFR